MPSGAQNCKSEQDFESTWPRVSRWDQDGAEYVSSDVEWVDRCARRMVEVSNHLEFEQARAVALEFGVEHELRAKRPELVAEDLLRVDVRLS